MLASSANTSLGTWIALATLVIMMIPVYIMSLKGAQSYGKLEQKVDQLTLSQAQVSIENAATNKLVAEAIAKLTDQFQAHAVQDAGHFGELRGMLTPQQVTVPGKVGP